MQHQSEKAEKEANEKAGAAREACKAQLELAEQERQVALIEAIKQMAAARRLAEDAGTVFTEAKKQKTAEPDIFEEDLAK